MGVARESERHVHEAGAAEAPAAKATELRRASLERAAVIEATTDVRQHRGVVEVCADDGAAVAVIIANAMTRAGNAAIDGRDIAPPWPVANVRRRASRWKPGRPTDATPDGFAATNRLAARVDPVDVLRPA